MPNPSRPASSLPPLPSLSLLLVLALAACGGGPERAMGGAQFGSGFTRAPASPEVQSMERSMAELVNRDRATEGRGPLEYDEELAEIARAHAQDMRDHHFFAHESPNTGTLEDRISRAGYFALESRENLAEAADIRTAEESLMKSPGHHTNIMAKSVTHIGIGIVRGGVKTPSNLTVTQVFAAPGELETPEVATSRILVALNVARRAAHQPTLSRDEDLDRLATRQIDGMPREPSPEALSSVGEAVTAQLSKNPIDGLSGVAVGGQLLWHSSQFTPPDAVARPNARKVGLAVRRVADERGRPQLKVLVLVGL